MELCYQGPIRFIRFCKNVHGSCIGLDQRLMVFCKGTVSKDFVKVFRGSSSGFAEGVDTLLWR